MYQITPKLSQVRDFDEVLGISGEKMPLYLFQPVVTLDLPDGKKSCLHKNDIAHGADMHEKSINDVHSGTQHDIDTLHRNLKNLGFWFYHKYNDPEKINKQIKIGNERFAQLPSNLKILCAKNREKYLQENKQRLLEEKVRAELQEKRYKQANDKETIKALVAEGSDAHLACITTEDLYKRGNLGRRAWNALTRNDVFNMAEICNLTHEAFNSFPGVGKLATDELAFSLNKMGGYFADDALSDKARQELLLKSRNWVRQQKLDLPPETLPVKKQTPQEQAYMTNILDVMGENAATDKQVSFRLPEEIAANRNDLIAALCAQGYSVEMRLVIKKPAKKPS